jgi:type II secretory pathway component GspD/PulD (secretin)
VPRRVFQTRLFELTYRDPANLLPVLRPLASGRPGSDLAADSELKTISVRDFPENIAAIGEALKRLDRPEARRPEVELRLHALVASNGDMPTSPMPVELDPVVKQLRSTLRYTSYSHVTSIIQRVRQGTSQARSDGKTDFGLASPGAPARAGQLYSCQFNHISLVAGQGSNGAAPAVMRLGIGKLRFEVREPGSNEGVLIETELNIRDGEQVVVGTAALRDRGLILVLSAKLLE